MVPYIEFLDKNPASIRVPAPAYGDVLCEASRGFGAIPKTIQTVRITDPTMHPAWMVCEAPIDKQTVHAKEIEHGGI